MSEFLWVSGHIGWGIFAATVFTGLWVLVLDVYWRLTNTRMTSFVGVAAAGWVCGIALIVLGSWLATR